MKIRLMGTKTECETLKKLFEEKLSTCESGYSISNLYPNRGSSNMYRVYIEIEQSILVQSKIEVNKLPNAPVYFDEGHKQYKGGK